jgi:glycopeptide antibiotics resistance protein
MTPAGGIDVMLLWVAVSGAVCGVVALAARHRWGAVTSFALAGFVWSLAVIAIVTLLPTDPDLGVVPAEGRATSCSTDIGGPAPHGFWILAGGQRLLNTVLFVPSGALLVLGAGRWRRAWLLVPIGVAGLASYSVFIELAQLELARLDRACDLTDVIDNVSGTVVGVVVGLVLTVVFRPWRHRR